MNDWSAFASPSFMTHWKSRVAHQLEESSQLQGSWRVRKTGHKKRGLFARKGTKEEMKP